MVHSTARWFLQRAEQDKSAAHGIFQKATRNLLGWREPAELKRPPALQQDHDSSDEDYIAPQRSQALMPGDSVFKDLMRLYRAINNCSALQQDHGSSDEDYVAPRRSQALVPGDSVCKDMRRLYRAINNCSALQQDHGSSDEDYVAPRRSQALVPGDSVCKDMRRLYRAINNCSALQQDYDSSDESNDYPTPRRSQASDAHDKAETPRMKKANLKNRHVTFQDARPSQEGYLLEMPGCMPDAE